MKNLFLLLGHSVKCWIHKQNFLLYFLWHILILGDDSEIYSLMIQKQSKHIQSGYKIRRKQRQRLIKQYKYKCDCVNKIWFSVLVFPCTNKQTLPNKRDDLFFPPAAAMSVEPCPIWLCKPGGSRQHVLFQTEVTGSCPQSDLSSALCSVLTQSRE